MSEMNSPFNLLHFLCITLHIGHTFSLKFVHCRVLVPEPCHIYIYTYDHIHTLLHVQNVRKYFKYVLNYLFQETSLIFQKTMVICATLQYQVQLSLVNDV